MFKKIFLISSMFSLAAVTIAQQKFENTIKYDSIKGSPKATLDQVKWIAGHWKGEAFGGITEEIWSPPLGRSMLGLFKLVVNGKSSFYELESISEIDSTLIVRLKHFSVRLKGWEEKDKTIDFKLVKITPNKVFFDEFTFERVSDNELNIYVVLKEDNKPAEVKFNYKKRSTLFE